MKNTFYVCKDGKAGVECLCRHPELIENYDLMMRDTSEDRWACHHRLETHFSDGTARPKDAQLTQEELKALGTYYDRTPEELIFMKQKDHMKLHHKGKIVSSTTRQKVSKKLKGNCNRAKVAVQCIETGQIFESLKVARIWAGVKENGSIRQACKVSRYTASGYHWRYV